MSSEIAYGLSDPCADGGQLPSVKNNKDNDHNDDKFRHTDSKHNFSYGKLFPLFTAYFL